MDGLTAYNEEGALAHRTNLVVYVDIFHKEPLQAAHLLSSVHYRGRTASPSETNVMVPLSAVEYVSTPALKSASVTSTCGWP